MKYTWIDRNKTQWPIALACEVLGVSASGYFQHRRRKKSVAANNITGLKRLSGEALLVQIRAIHAEVRQEYGYPRMTKELNARGLRVGKERVRKLMQLNGIKAKGKKRFVHTTDSNHKLGFAPDLVQRNFTPAEPNRVWSSDITYIAIDEGWLFLAVVLDLFSKRVVGWSMSPKMETSLVADALKMAWHMRHPDKGLIFHSDRGIQYCSEEFKRLADQYGMRRSMSRRANCWDNAPTESFWGSLKVGRLYGQRFATRRDAMDEVISWMSFYNFNRLHSSLGYVSPMEFEKQWYADRQKMAA